MIGKIFRFHEVLPQLCNVMFRRCLKFQFEMIPYDVKGLTFKKISNFFLFGLNQFFHFSKPIGYPVIAQVEPANFCNLSCPLCLTTSETSSRPKSLMKLDAFKKFIDEAGDYLLLIVLWNWGEPFLNPDIYGMIEYAKTKNILIHSSTNGNVVFDEEKAEKLVDSGIDTLIFGVDGATEETYRKYRQGGSLERVLNNIRTIVSVKKRKGVETPRLNLRFVVMRHNEHEIPLIEKMATELGVDYLSFKTVDLPPARGDSLDESYVPDNQKYCRYEYDTDNRQRKQKPFRCLRPWKRITMDSMGEIIPCEFDYRNGHAFGNIHDGNSATAVWKGERAVGFRKKFNLGWNDFYLCRDCQYKNMVDEQCVIELEDLQS